MSSTASLIPHRAAAPVSAAAMFEQLAPGVVRNLSAIRTYGGPSEILLPEDVVDALLHEMTAAMRASGSRERLGLVAVKLMSAYPPRSAESAEGAKRYLALLTDELREFPMFVVEPALRGLWRSSKFLPSIAEVVTACDAEAAQYRSLEGQLDQMSRAHIARRLRDEEEAERRRKDQAFLELRERIAVDLFACKGVIPGDYTAATIAFDWAGTVRHGRSALVEWSCSTPASWADWHEGLSRPLRAGGIAGRGLVGLLRKQVDPSRLVELCRAALEDETRGRALTADIEVTAADFIPPHKLVDRGHNAELRGVIEDACGPLAQLLRRSEDITMEMDAA